MVHIALELRLPIVDPDFIVIRGRARHPQGAPTGLFMEGKFSSLDIGEGEVGEINGVKGPGGTGLGIGLAHPDPKKSKLVAERLSLLGGQVAGIIPPFGFKLRDGRHGPGGRQISSPGAPSWNSWSADLVQV